MARARLSWAWRMFSAMALKLLTSTLTSPEAGTSTRAVRSPRDRRAAASARRTIGWAMVREKTKARPNTAMAEASMALRKSSRVAEKSSAMSVKGTA